MPDPHTGSSNRAPRLTARLSPRRRFGYATRAVAPAVLHHGAVARRDRPRRGSSDGSVGTDPGGPHLGRGTLGADGEHDDVEGPATAAMPTVPVVAASRIGAAPRRCAARTAAGRAIGEQVADHGAAGATPRGPTRPRRPGPPPGCSSGQPRFSYAWSGHVVINMWTRACVIANGTFEAVTAACGRHPTRPEQRDVAVGERHRLADLGRFQRADQQRLRVADVHRAAVGRPHPRTLDRAGHKGPGGRAASHHQRSVQATRRPAFAAGPYIGTLRSCSTCRSGIPCAARVDSNGTSKPMWNATRSSRQCWRTSVGSATSAPVAQTRERGRSVRSPRRGERRRGSRASLTEHRAGLRVALREQQELEGPAAGTATRLVWVKPRHPAGGRGDVPGAETGPGC